MHCNSIRFSKMELLLAASCFFFPVWALALQSYEGEREDDFDLISENNIEHMGMIISIKVCVEAK